MTRRSITILLTSALLAGACSGNEGTPTDSSVDTVAPTVTAEPTTTTLPLDPDVAEQADTHPELLAAVVLFPSDLPAAYADLELDTLETGYRPAGGDLSNALDPSDEADDIIRYGELGVFTTSFGTVQGGFATSVSEFATAAGAAGYLDDWVQDLERGANEPSADRHNLADFTSERLDGVGDQAVRTTYKSVFLIDDGTDQERQGAAVAIRIDNLITWVWGFGDEAVALVDELHPLLAQRLSGVLDGTIPARNPAILGLADPPTLALDSFAFEYEYGLDFEGMAFTITIDGVFEGPDRATCRTAYADSDLEPIETYVVVAGTRVWVGDVTGYSETPLRDPAALSALAGCPGHPNFWEVTRLHRLPIVGGETVTVDGIEAITTDLVDYPEALATAGFIDAEIEEFERYEVTVAADGGWPLRVEIERTLAAATALALYGIPPHEFAAVGESARVFDSLKITRIDDPTIEVTLPLLAG